MTVEVKPEHVAQRTIFNCTACAFEYADRTHKHNLCDGNRGSAGQKQGAVAELVPQIAVFARSGIGLLDKAWARDRLEQQEM
jgi:hypothetical protein